MLGRSSLLVLVLFLVACSPDSFRPAKNAYIEPPVKDSFRVKTAAPECLLLGYMNAEGEDGLADLARMAAKHGANAFLITNDDTDERVTEYGGGSVSPNAVTKTNHKYVASAYRCPNAPGVSDQASR